MCVYHYKLFTPPSSPCTVLPTYEYINQYKSRRQQQSELPRTSPFLVMILEIQQILPFPSFHILVQSLGLNCKRMTENTTLRTNSPPWLARRMETVFVCFVLVWFYKSSQPCVAVSGGHLHFISSLEAQIFLSCSF